MKRRKVIGYGTPLCSKCGNGLRHYWHECPRNPENEQRERRDVERMLDNIAVPSATTDQATVEALTNAILAIDAKATPYGSGIVENGEEYVTRYIMPAGPLHRALGLIGRCAAKPAAPDVSPTGYVPVKRELLERWTNMLQHAVDQIEAVGVVSNRIETVWGELRALLSPAPSSGTDRR